MLGHKRDSATLENRPPTPERGEGNIIENENKEDRTPNHKENVK
jgi:hypothetical protein